MTQLVRSIPTALGTLFDSGKTLVAEDLVTITLLGGSVYRWTTYDQPITVDGTTWTLGPGLETSRLKWTAGVEVDTMTITMIADGRALINGGPLMPFINGGGLDGAKVQIWRAYTDLPTNGWVGKLHRFTGYVSDIDRPSKVEASIQVRSIFELLNQQLPRNVYQPQCSNMLYDSACTVSKAAQTTSTSVTTASDSQLITIGASGTGQPDGFYDLGAVRFTSGANNGVVRTVRRFASGVITFVQPLPVAASIGDTFQIYPGCDKSLTTCQGRFSNQLHFRGYPYIPVAESVL